MADPITMTAALTIGTGMAAVGAHSAILFLPSAAAVNWHKQNEGRRALNNKTDGNDEVVPFPSPQLPRWFQCLPDWITGGGRDTEVFRDGLSRLYSRWSRYTKYSQGRITGLMPELNIDDIDADEDGDLNSGTTVTDTIQIVKCGTGDKLCDEKPFSPAKPEFNERRRSSWAKDMLGADAQKFRIYGSGSVRVL